MPRRSITHCGLGQEALRKRSLILTDSLAHALKGIPLSNFHLQKSQPDLLVKDCQWAWVWHSMQNSTSLITKLLCFWATARSRKVRFGRQWLRPHITNWII